MGDEFCLSAETIAAVHRTVVAGLEGHLAGLAALGANSVIHLAAATLTTAGVAFACIAAGLAALRLVGEALFSKELLFAGCEGELLSAILADDSFVLKHVIPLLS